MDDILMENYLRLLGQVAPMEPDQLPKQLLYEFLRRTELWIHPVMKCAFCGREGEGVEDGVCALCRREGRGTMGMFVLHVMGRDR